MTWTSPPPPVDLPLDNAVDLAHRLALVVILQCLPEEDHAEARRRVAALLHNHGRLTRMQDDARRR